MQQWLNLSKNPPSLAFLCFEFSVLGVLLVVFAAAASRGVRLKALSTFGQTALFFYALHFYVLGIAVGTWIAFAVLIVARVGAGWRGRRAAWLTLGGFGGTALVVAAYFLRHAV